MALRTLQAVVANNFYNLTADPVLAGDIVAFNINATAGGALVNPACVARAARINSASGSAVSYTSDPPGVVTRGQIVGVCGDDALGINPSGETPFMINNDPAGSNFVNGNVFQTYTAGFYVGPKRAIGDFKDESIAIVSNLTQQIPIYDGRPVTVYTTPSTQFVTDRFANLTAQNMTVDAANWTGSTGSTVPSPGDLLTVGANQSSAATANVNANLNTNYPAAPTFTSATNGTNNAGLLVSVGSLSAGIGTAVPVVGRVDYYDSGAGLLYWTLL